MTRLELLESKLAEVNVDLDRAIADVAKMETLPYSIDLLHRRRDVKLLRTRKGSLEMQVRVAQDHAGITNYID